MLTSTFPVGRLLPFQLYSLIRIDNDIPQEIININELPHRK